MVPCFRRDRVWIPEFTPEKAGAGMTRCFNRRIARFRFSKLLTSDYLDLASTLYVGFSFNAAKTFSGVMGRSLILTPTAS